MRLKIRSILIFIWLFTVLGFTGLGFYFYNALRTQMLENLTSNMRSHVTQSNAILTSNLSSVLNTYYTIISDPIINYRLYADISYFENPYDDARTSDRLIKLAYFNDSWIEKRIRSITLLDAYANTQYLNADNSARLNETIVSAMQETFSLTPGGRPARRINGMYCFEKVPDAFFYIRDYYSINSATFEKLVAIMVDRRAFAQAYGNMTGYEGMCALLYDEDGLILTATDDRLWGADCESALIDGKPIADIVADRKHYFVCTDRIGGSNSMDEYTSMAIIPLGPLYRQLSEKTAPLLLVLTLLGAGFAGLASVLFVRVTRYISAWMNRIEEVGCAQYEGRAPRCGVCELDLLSDTFDYIALQTRILIQRIQEQRLNLREAEIRMLYSQINPHFIFNTLCCIALKARDRGAQDVYEMITCLGNLMRQKMHFGGNIDHTLREELACTEEFLHLQKLRFEQRLTYETDLRCPQALDCTVPRLALLTIVENAIIHGIEKRTQGGRIKIVIERAQGGLMLTVEDNGPGFPEAMADASGYNDAVDGRHIGLHNTQKRIEHRYGKPYGIIINSPKGGPTRVSIYIPEKTT